MPVTTNPTTVVTSTGIARPDLVNQFTALFNFLNVTNVAALSDHEQAVAVNDPTASGSALIGIPDDMDSFALLAAATASGGVGTISEITNAHEAWENVNSRLVNLRFFNAKVVDGTLTVGGDFVGGAGLDTIWRAASSPFAGELPRIFIDSGAYAPPDAVWDDTFSVFKGTGSSSIDIAAGQTADLFIESLITEGFNFTSSHATFRWKTFDVTSCVNLCNFAAGAVTFQGLTQFQTVTKCIVSSSLSTVETSNYGAEIGITRGNFVDCVFDGTSSSAGAPVAAVLLNTSNPFDFEDVLTFKNCRFKSGTATGADALFLDNWNSKVIFEDCFFEVDATDGGWAVEATSSSLIVFKNCTFESNSGRIVRLDQSAASFTNCLFLSNSGSTLGTKPQAFVATSSPSPVDPTIIENCSIGISDSNIDATGAPITPIVELGGEAATAGTNTGQIQVDGLYIINAGTGVHNFTTVVLHGNNAASSTAVNSYKNVTIDAFAIDPTSAGTLSGILTAGGLLEVISLAGKEKTIIENLRVINIPNPTVTHVRNVIFIQDSVVDTLYIDGASSGGAQNYATEILELRRTFVNDFYMTPTFEINCSAASYIDSRFTSQIIGGIWRYRNSGTLSAVAISNGAFCDIKDWLIFIETDLGVSFIAMSIGQIEGNTIILDDTSSVPLITSGTIGIQVKDNNFRWENPGGTIASFTGDNSLVTGNIFSTTNGAIPSLTNSGTGSIGDSTNNQIYANATTLNPEF